MTEKIIITPSTVITINLLKKLCEQYSFEIGVEDQFDYLPKIRIRYVEENGKFCYANFGEFFMFYDDLYVWKYEEKYKEMHNEDLVEEIFGDHCLKEGYFCRFLYAGADTNFVDTNGEHIFVGDILNIGQGYGRDNLALSYFEGYDNAAYCFILDNHSLRLDDCIKKKMPLTRVGTAYFQLDITFNALDMYNQTRDFNGWHDSNEEYEDKVFMARYTPNFDQEIWKYHALEIIGVEYNWR